MTDCLFVYGTLMRTAERSDLGRDMRERLEREASWIGSATIPGCLLDLGQYPALAGASGPDDVVHGEVWRLFDAVATLSWLDPYEGIAAGCVRGDEYERHVRRVRIVGGATVEAFVYLYIGDRTGLPLIVSGCWSPHGA